MEMLKNGNNNSGCDRSEEMVAYIYNDIAADERQRFELHLADCMHCTDDFAEISDARFSVFEWHREEFADLATPRFSIPYAAKKEVSVGAGFWDMFRTNGWAFAGASAVIVCLGLIFAVISFSDRPENDVAAVVPAVGTQTEPPAREPVRQQEKIDVTANSVEEKTVDIDEKDTRANNPVARPIRATTVRSKRQPSAKPRNTVPTGKNFADVPVLSSYEDNEDRSLRLSDLLEEVGG